MLKHFLTITIFAFIACNTFAQPLERSKVENQYKWNLAEIYPTTDAWKADMDMMDSQVEKLADFKGKLGESAKSLYEALKLGNDLTKTLYKAWTYASNLSNEDLNIAKNQAMIQQMSALGTKFSETSAFMEPEILQIPKEKIDQFFKEEPGLKEFDMYINNIIRMRAHTLSAAEEKILASFNLIAGNQDDVYGIFNNAEKPAPKITLSDGKEVELTPASYTRYRTLPDREDREKVMDTFFNSYGIFKNTLGANLGGKVKTDWVYAKDRKYSSSLEASLDRDNIPVSVYSTLIEQVNKNLPTLYRFLDLKKRMLGVDSLHYYDLYVPLVEKVDMSFTIEQGQEVLLSALKPLGKEYVATLQNAFKNRW